MNVSAFGLWQMMLGPKGRRINIEGSTLRDLIRVLDHMTSGKVESEVLVTNGRLDPKFKIFVNGREIDNLTTSLAEGDDVMLFGVIDGG